MATSEINGDGRATKPSGRYRHPQTGEEIIAQATERFGNPQADAFVRLGFEYVGPVEEKKVKTNQVDVDAKPVVTDSQSEAESLRAELAKAQERISELETKKAAPRTSSAKTVTPSKEGGAK